MKIICSYLTFTIVGHRFGILNIKLFIKYWKKCFLCSLKTISKEIAWLNIFQMVIGPSLINISNMLIGIKVGRLRRPKQNDNIVFFRLCKHCTTSWVKINLGPKWRITSAKVATSTGWCSSFLPFSPDP